MNDKKPTPLHPGWLAGDTEEPSDADYRLVFAEVEKRIAETGESFDDAVMNVAKSDDRKGYLIAYVQFDAVRALAEGGNENATMNPMQKTHASPRCGAKTRKGIPCKAPAMRNGRCRLHGGKSTGPRTLEGLERSRKARRRHGRYSAEAKAERRHLRQLMRKTGVLMEKMIDAKIH